MSGAEDLARLTGTIDILNEITISPEIKDVDVGNGEIRPTVTKALSIAATQFGGAMPYTSIEEALTNTISGTVFSVPSKLGLSPDPLKYIDMYLNDGGEAVPLGDYPSGAALRAVSELVKPTDSVTAAHEFLDGYRFTLAKLMSDGTLDLLGALLKSVGGGFELADANGFISTRLGFRESLINGLSIKFGDFDGLEFADEHGFVAGKIGAESAYFGQGITAPPASSIALLNQQQRTDHMMLLGYGQSLAVGENSKPATSLVQPYNNLMLAGGVKVLPGDSGYTSSSYAPLVESDFGARGETPVSGACNGLVRRVVEAGEFASDWVVVGSAAGRGGKSIEQLSPSPLGDGYFETMVQVVRDCHALSTGLGKSFSVWAYTWDQGESNYTLAWTKSSYQYMQYQLDIFDRLTDKVVEITEQKFQPYLFTYQVSAHRKYSVDDMSISLSQWRASKERGDVVLATPVYIIPTGDDALHLTNEGSWLLGEYRSRALYETMVRRRGKWRPLEPVGVDWAADHIEIKFHVPRGELVLDDALAALAPNFGFDIRESNSVITDIIAAVSVTGRDTVRISLSRPAALSAVLSYARGRNGDPAASGPLTGARGNLRDTHGLFDTAVSPLGNSFALHNACVMFQFDRKTGF